MARTASRKRFAWLGSVGLAALVMGPAQAQELPTGGQVVAGSAMIGGANGAAAITQTSARAVIDWKSFGVGVGGTVTIAQPDGSSALLNRVTGSDISRIAGNISANGQVFLVNRNGIIITPTGTIDARGGFVGSTLGISNEDFMAGRLRFAGAAGGMVLNQGRIAGGAIALLGANVGNEGVIISPLGKVALASGEEATLDLSGDGYLQVLVPASMADADGKPLVSNSGRIEAEGGLVVLSAATARAAVRQLVNMSGVIAARSVTGHDGVVLLGGGAGGSATVSGSIDVSGTETGGRIDITAGDSVSLTGATLAATGGARGGIVRVGGMFQGGGLQTEATSAQTDRFVTRFGASPTLAAADFTTVDAASSIDVSGGVDGGTAVLWSTRGTDQAGRISAGGANGGAVELSSRGRLTTSLARVAAGTGGILLLDPKNIFVADDGSIPALNPAMALPAGGVVNAADPGADPAITYFRINDVIAQMNAGTDVVLRASNDINWSPGGTAAAVDFGFSSSGRSGNLTLAAGRSVSIAGFLTLYSSSLTVIANDSAANGVIDADRDPGGARIDTFNAVISAQTGSTQTPGDIRLTLGTGAGLTNRAIATSNRLGNISGGNITLDTSGQTTRWTFFAPQGQALDPVNVMAKNAVTITGSILAQVIDGLTFSGTSVTWTDEATSSVSNNSFGYVAFVENGVTTRFGKGAAPVEGGGSGFARVGLGNGAAYAPISYGDAPLTATQFYLRAGALRPGDTLTTLAGAFTNVATNGVPGAFAARGSYTITTTAAIDRANAPGGYFFDLRPASDTLVINPRALLPTVTNGNYVYGSPTALVTLAGIVNGDTVLPVATLDSVPDTQLVANGSGFGFGQTLGAGNHSFALTGLAGAGAGNYTLDTSGNVAGTIAIARKSLNYQIFDATATYGTIGTAFSALNGLVGTDAVTLSLGSAGFSTTASVGNYAITGTGLTGTASANYLLATSGNSDGTLTIQPKPITYIGIDGSSVYGDVPLVTAPTLSGIINGDAVSATALFNGISSPLGQTSNAGTYTVTAGLGGAGAGNYVIASSGNVAGNFTITRRPITFSLADTSTEYGTAGPVLTLNGLTGLDDARPIALFDGVTTELDSAGTTSFGIARVAVGSHDFVFSGLRGVAAANYLLDLGAAATRATYAVTPKLLTYAVADSNRTFRTDQPLPGFTLFGVLGQDFGNVSGELSVNGATVTSSSALFPLNAGRYAASLSGLTGTAASNYRLAASGNQLGTITVMPAFIGYTLSDVSTIYGSVATPTAFLTNTYFQDDVRGIVSFSRNGASVVPDARTGVGSYVMSVTTLAGANAGNYVLAPGGPNATLTITPKSLTYAIGSSSLVYGQTLGSPAISLGGVVAGDTVTGTIGFATSTILGQPLSDLPARFDVGTYFLGLRGIAGADAGNYVLATTGNSQGVITVTPKALTYQIAPVASIYGDNAVLAVATLLGVEAGDTIAPGLTFVLAGGDMLLDTVALAAGRYGTTISSITGTRLFNYVLDGAGLPTGTLDIARRPVSGFLFVPSSAVYGTYRAGEVPVVASLGNVMSFDAGMVGPVLAPASEIASSSGLLAAGRYTYTVSGLTGGQARNYVLTGSQTGTLTVTPKALGFTPGQAFGNGFVSTYGTAADIAPPTLTGVLNGESVVSAGITVTSGTGNIVTIGSQTPVGGYAITAAGLSGADAGNYSIVTATSVLTVVPKTINYALGNSAWTYGDTPVFAPASFTGLVGSDVVIGARAIIYTDRSNAGTYTDTLIGLTGPAASNYVFAATGNVAGTIRINPRSLVFVPANTAQTITYLDAFPSFGALSGVLAGDAVAVATEARIGGTRFSTTNLDAGSYVIGLARQNGTSYQLFGDSARNYTLPGTGLDSFATLTVRPRGLSYVASAPASAVFGDTVPISFAFSGAPQSALDALRPTTLIDGVALPDPQTGLNAGTRSITARLDNPNYIVEAGVAATIQITRRALTYSITAPSSATYGDSFDYRINLLQTVPDQVRAEVDAGLRVDGQSFTNLQAALTAGTRSLSVVLPNQNYSLSGTPTTIAIAKRPLVISMNDARVVYGATSGNDLVTVSNIANDDRFFVQVKLGNTSYGLTNVGNGFGGLTPLNRDVPFVDFRNAGTYEVSLSSFTGTAIDNYSLNNVRVSTLTVTPKPLTYTIASQSRQYGGLTAPAPVDPLSGVLKLELDPLRLDGLLESDAFQVSGIAGVIVNGQAAAYTSTLAPGSYALTGRSLTGAEAGNYILATAGNQTGTFTVTPAALKPEVSSGGRLYNFGDRSNFQIVGTPGQISFRRGFNDPGLLSVATGLVSATDDVSVLVQVFQNNQPYLGTDFPVGTYELRPTALIGADVGKYRLITGGSGELLVQDSSIFGFSFLTSTPNNVYAPPASVTTFTASITGTAGTTAATQTNALSFVARADGYAGASASVGYGIVDLTTTVAAETSAVASFGPRGLRSSASVGVSAEVTLTVGPASATYGGAADLTATANLGATGLKLSAVANASIDASLNVEGGLGGGVSGSATTTASVFAEARTVNRATVANGELVVKQEQWTGVGVSVGAGGSLSGGGFGGSASVTVYSPGSLGLGSSLQTGYTDGTVTVGFKLAIAIGIGGLEINPSFSFKPADLANTEAGRGVIQLANDIGASFGIGCNASCRANNAAQAESAQKLNLFNQAAAILARSRYLPTVELLSFLAANPGVTSMSDKDLPADMRGSLSNMQRAVAEFGSIPDQLNSTVQKQQALVRKLQASPGGVSLADLREAQTLRAQEAALIGQLATLGGKVQVANGQITMVAK